MFSRWGLIFGLVGSLFAFQACATQVVISTCPWTVPADWNSASNTIEAIGAGGGGNNATTGSGGEGGAGAGGGAYVKSNNVTLTPSGTMSCQIGVAGAHSNAGGTGTDTIFNGSHTTCGTVTGSESCAQGGQAPATVITGGLGGLSATSVCTGASCVKNSGGSGGNAPIAAQVGGGGGGAAGPTGVGAAGGTGNSGGVGGPGGGGADGGATGGTTAGNPGGAGGNNAGASGGGTAGSFPGGAGGAGSNGGGGAGGAAGSAGSGGAGGVGGAEATWTTEGPGGGGGTSGFSTVGQSEPQSGAGAKCGGGGAGGSINSGATSLGLGGDGGGGCLVATYTPAAGGPAKNNLLMGISYDGSLPHGDPISLRFHGMISVAGQVPIISNPGTVNSYSPTTNGQPVVTLTATQSPTSWAIASCSGCTNYFAISNGGALTVAPTGASNITANNTTTATTFNPVITATNATGTSLQFAAAVTFYADGFANAATGAVQRSTLLNGYVARPSWKVAGVDYAVGYGSSVPATDPSTIASVPGCVYTAGPPPVVTCSTAGQTISGFDFSLHNGTVLNCAAANLVIKQNNFKAGSATTTGTALVSGNSSCTGLLVQYNDIDGGNASGSQVACTYAALIFTNGAGATVEFNWLKNSGGQNFDVQGGGTVLERYNLIENSALCSPNHNNYLQFTGIGSTTYTSPKSIFNTTYQSILNTGVNPGEGIQVEAQSGATTITNAEVGRNTLVAALQVGAKTLSYMIACHQDSGGNSNTGFSASNNYLDVRGADGFAYPSAGSNVCPSPVYSNNINMVTGAAFTTSP